MKMEIDLETMLEIALGGPEIGPLNLQVLYGIMREVFQRINLSNQNIVVEDDNDNFCNSFNFIKSKIDEKNKRPRTAGGGTQKFKSNVSVIVSEYVREPIGEHINDSKETPLLSSDVEDRLRYIESELKNAKDFPTIEELRTWAKEKTTPDTVVTDLWHFVSLNHRVSGLEEGIQKLSTLVDKLIPELKALGEEQNNVNGKVDDLYSQFKGLSDRMTYIDNKIDHNIDDVNANVETRILNIVDTTRRIENRFVDHPKFADLKNLITADVFDEVQEMARGTVTNIREELSSKLNYSILDKMASQEDLKNFVDVLNSVDAKIVDCARIGDLEKFVTNNIFLETQKKCQNIAKEIGVINVTLAGKADISVIDGLVIREDIDKLSNRVNDLAGKAEQQALLSHKINLLQSELNKKADNDDVVDVLKKEDMKKTFNKIQNHQCILNDLQNWQKTFINEENPLLHSKLSELVAKTTEMSDSLSNLQEEHMKKPWENVSEFEDSIKRLDNQLNELENTHKTNMSNIRENIEVKLNRTELQPLKDYLENCYTVLYQQYVDAVSDAPLCNHKMHQPKPPKSSHGIPYISKTNINIARKNDGGCSNCDTFIPSKNDAAVITTQMKYNCLSCSQPLSASSCQLQTIRGKPLNTYELDHLKVLQKMLNSDEDSRSCGGMHTSSIPFKKTGRTSAKSLPSTSNSMAFTSQDGIMIDGEVDIEGLDGKLYRGLISRKDFTEHTRCKSASAHLRTVNPKPGTRVDRPISAKNLESRSFNYARATTYS